MNLSEHFTLRELIRSETADRMGIDNVPTQTEIIRLEHICDNILEPVREQFGAFRPNSGFRCLELNRAIGSKDNSQHIKGEAVDFEIPGIPNRHLFEWCVDNLDFDQCLGEFLKPGDPQAGWIHCSYVSLGNRHDVREIG